MSWELHIDRKRAECFNQSLDAFKLSPYSSREALILNVRKLKDYVDRFYDDINKK